MQNPTLSPDGLAAGSALPLGSAVPSASTYPSPASAWYMMGILVITTIVAFLDRQIIALLVEPIRHNLGLSDTKVSLLQGVSFSLCYAGAMLPLGRLVDRASRRNIIVAGALCWSVATIACGLSTSYWQLFVARMGVGMSEACMVPASYSLAADLFAPSRRGRAIGVLGIGLTLGSSGSLLITGLILSMTGSAEMLTVPILGEIALWRFIFIVVGLPGLVTSLLMLTTREPGRQTKIATLSDKPSVRELLAYIRQHRRSVVAVISAGALVSVSGVVTSLWGPTSLIRTFGVSPATVGVTMGIAATIGGVLGPLISGFTTDWHVRQGHPGGRLALFWMLGPLSIIGSVIFSFAPTFSIAVIGTGICLVGFSGLTSAIYCALADLAPSQFRGQLTALAVVTFNIAMAFAPTIVALFTEHVYERLSALNLSIASTAIPSMTVATTIALLNRRQFSATVAHIDASSTGLKK